MVRALLAGTKTQTRRIVKPQPARVFSPGSAFPMIGEVYAYNSPDEGWMLVRAGRQPRENALVGRCPYGVPGDALWVRETFRLDVAYDNDRPTAVPPEAATWFVADQGARGNGVSGKTRVSIHMPRWASRISLRVTDVRVERLNAISEADAEAEGCKAGRLDDGFAPIPFGDGGSTIESPGTWASAAGMYQILWDEINGEGAWDEDPFVWVVSFEIVR